MKWILSLILFFSACSPFSWKGARTPSSENVSTCIDTINVFAEHTALTPFEKRTQILYQEMLAKKTKVTYEDLVKMDKQAELMEILESINARYGLPEIDFAMWFKDHSAGDLKTMLKIFKKFQSEKKISTYDVEKMTIKLYRLLNGYRPFYKKIPFYSSLQEILKQAPDEKILEAIRTRIWIEGLSSHVKTIGRNQDPSIVQKLLRNKNRWSNQINITLATLLEIILTSATGDLTPLYVPTLKLFDHKKITAEILESVAKNGWQNTKTILEKHFQKSLVLDRYYNYLTYTYNNYTMLYMFSTCLIVADVLYQEQQEKNQVTEKAYSELNALMTELQTNLGDLQPKTEEEQAESFAQSLRESGVAESKIAEMKLRYLEVSKELTLEQEAK
jgi:hypothetical protein